VHVLRLDQRLQLKVDSKTLAGKAEGAKMVSLKITGFHQVERELKELSEATAALDANICQLKFDPSNRSDVERAVRQMETEIDRRISRWRNNAAVKTLVEKTKARFRKEILDRASAAKG